MSGRLNTRRPWLVVSIHDVAPATAAQSREWLDELDRREVPGVLLVIPGPWRARTLAECPEMCAWLRQCAGRGHEVALHGWRHTVAPAGPFSRRMVAGVAARGCGEFWSLDEDEAQARAGLGRAALVDAGLSPAGFTPPGWLASRPALAGLRRAGLRYSTSHAAVTDLRTAERHQAVALSHRPGGRGERTGAWLMNRGSRELVRSGRPVRLALHPADLARPGLKEAALHALDMVLELGARPTTYEELVTAGPRR